MGSATANAASRLVVVGETAQLQFDLFDAGHETVDDLIEPLRAGSEKAWIDALHLAPQVLYVAGDFVWNLSISAEYLIELREIANPFAEGALGIGAV